MNVEKETEFEEKLIQYLEQIGGSKQWEYLPHVKTVPQLWQNFRNILERNNQDKLQGTPLSDAEFAQVQARICELKNPYEAGCFIYGINGVTQVDIARDDGSTVFLTIFDQDQVGAGNTTYQIVNQIEREHVQAGNQDRRFDTTLLINGLPIIHIEEKADRHDANEGLNQIRQYIGEGLFGDIYSTVQILVGMTPHDVKYMANTDARTFNTDFAFRWQREDTNEPVWQWREFCDLFLSIPAAHRMATNYMILDGGKQRKNLMVMRPYQVYATQRVISKLKQHEFGIDKPEVGYVWHTTGSGKTVSSFKTAWLASRLPNVDKVIFLVDRRSLTSQTYDNYSAYDPDTDEDNNGGIISDTRNTGDLLRRIRSKERGNNILVTSIQKMGRLAKSSKLDKIDKNIVFIVDEAHRSTNGSLLPIIKSKFPRSAWVGYTGTPAFDGDLTHKAFGSLIHAYTIREAIADRNVLGFQVDFEHTLSEDQLKEKLLPELLKAKYPNASDRDIERRIASMDSEEAESLVDSDVYDCNQQHVDAVVEDIVNHWNNRSANGKYSAILTTHVKGGQSSVPMALMYFETFQKANQKRMAAGKEPLNVAVTFSMSTDNKDDQYDKNVGLKQAIRLYNSAFGTQFGADTVDEYFADVTQRLSGKQESGAKLDIVIVIDQLLTGFDSKIVNTLYVDRVLSGAGLIQAYSRTNRILDMQSKPFGHVVNYRWPEMSKRLMDAAIKVYANPDSAVEQGTLDSTDSGVLAMSFEERIKHTAKIVNELRTLTSDFSQVPASEAKQAQAAELLREYNQQFAALEQYTAFDENHPEELLSKLHLTEDNHEWMLTGLLNELKRRVKTSKDEHTFDLSTLDFEAEHVIDVRVNYDYIDELLAQLLNQVHNEDPNVQQTYEDLKNATDRMPDRLHADQITRTARDAINGNLSIPDYPVIPEDVNGIVNNHMRDERRSRIVKFRKTWGLVDVATAAQLIAAMLEKHVAGRDDVIDSDQMTSLLHDATATRFYVTDADSEEVRALRPMEYRKRLRIATSDLIEELSEFRR